ncbi:hypothetical protein E2P64_06215 [Candidatus Bathyarchaeota archaeon]|nr:hypothetical protein E2P64_06215 [Candidatus Bathyarchaeota archaeon]
MASAAGKGMDPKKGYDYHNWYANFDQINWHRKDKWCAWCGKWGNHTSGSCKDLAKATTTKRKKNGSKTNTTSQ